MSEYFGDDPLTPRLMVEVAQQTIENYGCRGPHGEVVEVAGSWDGLEYCVGFSDQFGVEAPAGSEKYDNGLTL